METQHLKHSSPGTGGTCQFHGNKQGFALVVTLTQMVLLSVLAIGMLSLATTELRSVSRADSYAVARANAMMGLHIAIGDLQASAGPDQRITAPGGALGPDTTQQMITGVWKSKKLGLDSNSTDFSSEEKENQFVSWLVSDPDRERTSDPNFAKTSPSGPRGVVDLVSATNLDSGAPVVQAAKVPLTTNSGSKAGVLTGTYAYAVLDEGVKARVNIGILTSAGDLANASTALGAGQRPILSGIPGIGKLDSLQVNLLKPEGRSLVAKMVSLQTSVFAYHGSDKDVMKRRFHDLTSSSLGILADVVNGGLKKDLNLLAEMKADGGLPAEYAGRKIYEQSLSASVISDPSWDRALTWAGIFRGPNFIRQSVGGISAPTLVASAPPGWTAGIGKSSGGTSNPASATLSLVDPPGPVLLPSVAKIQMSFSLAARDIYDYQKGDPKLGADAQGLNPGLHDPWNSRFQEDLNQNRKLVESPFDYLLHMVYSPIITLHNPYNVPMSFTNLRVEFVNMPFSFQVFKNGLPQTHAPVPFGQMYKDSDQGGNTKRFGLTLTDTLLPGEVKVYSPNIPPGRTWREEVKAGSGQKVFWDWGNRSLMDGRTGGTATDTSAAMGRAGWNGPSVGYDLDFLAPGPTQAYKHETWGTARFNRHAGIPLKKGDTIYVESTPRPDPMLPEKKFSVEMTLATDTATKARSTALVFSFDDPKEVEEVVMAQNPQAEGGKVRSPKGTDVWTTDMLFDHATVALRDIKSTRPFAFFSAYAKTTAGGDPSGDEGLWVAKPFSFQNHTSVAIEQKLKSGHPSHYSHELALTRFPELGVGVQAGSNRAKFITGHSDFRGRHFGTLYDVPLAPLQSLVSLNSAQLAAGTYLPHFTAPVGNSYAHPLIPPASVITEGAAGYPYADHSFLLNAALFDSYYCSGFQSHAPTSLDGDGRSRANIVSEFIAMAEPGSTRPSPLPDPRLKPYFADGMTRAEAVSTLTGDEAYRKAAALQMVEGAFNVNSISVPAWKAVLSSMSGESAMMLATPLSESNSSTLSKLLMSTKNDPADGRFSRFRISNGNASREDPNEFWRGPIDLDEAQITQFAQEIVNQVKERGPFLSMAEFVNRQLGPSGDLSLKGALQAAIDKSGINDGVSSSAESGIQIDSSQTANLQMPNAAALVGDSAQGAPGYLMQSDVLAVLGNTASVRSDTFTIRAYGEALTPGGNVIARVYCEAVVQRNPEFVDPQNRATELPADLNDANKNFGRRFSLISLKWLSPEEI
jgi:hypothetical protein